MLYIPYGRAVSSLSICRGLLFLTLVVGGRTPLYASAMAGQPAVLSPGTMALPGVSSTQKREGRRAVQAPRLERASSTREVTHPSIMRRAWRHILSDVGVGLGHKGGEHASPKRTVLDMQHTPEAALRKSIEMMPRAYSNYPDEEFGVLGENGSALEQRVETPLGDQDHVTHSGPPLPHPESLLPQMKWNHWLRQRGVAFMVDTTNEYSGAVTKPTKGLGLRQGSSNAGQYSFENDIDWNKLAGIPGFETHMIGVGRYGIPSSRMFGDNVNPSSEIYGGGGNVAFHFVFFYGEETLWHGRLNVAAGRMSMLSDFANSPLYCNFMNNAFCGNPKTSTDNYARASYPGSIWGTRIRARPTKNVYIQLGLYFPERGIYGVQQNRSGFKFNGATISGVLTPLEVGWEPQFGRQHLLGHYKIGFAPDTSDHYLGVFSPPNRRNAAMAAMSIPNCPTCWGVGQAVPGTGQRRNFGWGLWFLADQMLVRHPTKNTPEGGLIAFVDAYWNKSDIAMRGRLFAFGLVDTGFWPARPLDTIGIAFSYTGSSKYTRRAQRYQIAHGMAPAAGDPFYQNSGGPLMWGSYGVQRWGSTLEATYRIHVMRGVIIGPDFQYYFHPGMQRRLKDAALFGVKSHVQFF